MMVYCMEFDIQEKLGNEASACSLLHWSSEYGFMVMNTSLVHQTHSIFPACAPLFISVLITQPKTLLPHSHKYVFEYVISEFTHTLQYALFEI